MCQQLRNVYNERCSRPFREDYKTLLNDIKEYLKKYMIYIKVKSLCFTPETIINHTSIKEKVYGLHRRKHLIQQRY